MARTANSLLAAAAALLLLLPGCDGSPEIPASGSAARGKLGLLTSLPITHPLGADVAAIASGAAGVPWQREAIERDYALVPLDTLAPVPALSPGAPATDPLKGLARLAVIQPRALSPQDNVALDAWVRGGGRLLLVLDPVLTGEYDLPLGDPRRPLDAVLIPAVVRHWGLVITLPGDEVASTSDGLDKLPDGSEVPLDHPGLVTLSPGLAAACTRHGIAGATCRVGKGRVTLIADAAVFEHANPGGRGDAILRAVVRAAVE